MDGDREELDQSVAALVDEYRERCLWFLRPDFRPSSDDEILRTLSAIEKNGDLRAFREAARLRKWLSRLTSEASAA